MGTIFKIGNRNWKKIALVVETSDPLVEEAHSSAIKIEVASEGVTASVHDILHFDGVSNTLAEDSRVSSDKGSYNEIGD